TFGIMIYQEQVMQIAQELAGYSLGSADLLRRAMGKKIKSEMEAQRKTFVDGATARGVPRARAELIFEQVAKFAGYGFNKSHAAAYAMVAYQTAYLKANHPVEFLAASMTFDMGNTDKLNLFRQELSRLDIPLLPPDVNRSRADFGVELLPDDETEGPSHGIRYALGAIRNVGVQAMRQLVAEREANGPFEDLSDFVARIDPRALNKRQVENLACAGAFDSLDDNRHRVWKGAEVIVRHAAAATDARESAQASLFDGPDGQGRAPLNLPEVEDWPAMDRLRHEFEAIGFYLSAHPLDTYGKSLTRLRVVPSAELPALIAREAGRHKVAGLVIGKQERTSRQGNRFAFVQLSDTSGVFEVVVFSDVLARTREILESGEPLLVTVEGRIDGDDVRLMAQDAVLLETAVAEAGSGLRLYLSDPTPLETLHGLLAGDRGGRGRIAVVLDLDGTQELELELKETYRLSPRVRQAIKAIPGVHVQDF
ncbi:MAG TPA: OB-fold nucleic acid binding domain-containing protein, partial [Kiloniellales bacterium]|nr:OB-fold nucleic acid binding domain-containing protein [Kiloniellales bacterium]